mmetsp:Transcript_38579/g.65903  ORF Transcript_38579/g.65903 Transcript_38579/m.65903 type:complete len:144 (+) Transcript_38579:155-586(+)
MSDSTIIQFGNIYLASSRVRINYKSSHPRINCNSYPTSQRELRTRSQYWRELSGGMSAICTRPLKSPAIGIFTRARAEKRSAYLCKEYEHGGFIWIKSNSRKLLYGVQEAPYFWNARVSHTLFCVATSLSHLHFDDKYGLRKR